MSSKDYLNIIVYCNQPQVNGNKFLKYHNIKNTPHHIAKFAKFAMKFPGAEYMNLYWKHNKAFKERIYFF